jgi:hypothetical protein
MTNLVVKVGVLATIAALIGLAIIILIAVLEPKPYYQRQRTKLLDDERTPRFHIVVGGVRRNA